MSVSAEFIEYVKELFIPLGSLENGSFFGGFAFKSGTKQFAMIMGNTLYFCVNDKTRLKYEAKGMEPFSYSTKKGIVNVKKYYSAPEELFEDQEKLVEWAKEAIESAYNA
ncbi:MAG: TfoX/Sxy family protein [Methylococcales bacterium]